MSLFLIYVNGACRVAVVMTSLHTTVQAVCNVTSVKYDISPCKALDLERSAKKMDQTVSVIFRVRTIVWLSDSVIVDTIGENSRLI